MKGKSRTTKNAIVIASQMQNIKNIKVVLLAQSVSLINMINSIKLINHDNPQIRKTALDTYIKLYKPVGTA